MSPDNVSGHTLHYEGTWVRFSEKGHKRAPLHQKSAIVLRMDNTFLHATNQKCF